MNMFDGDFSAEDACVLGGAMGFAEESMRAEEEDPEKAPEEEEEVEIDSSEIKGTDLNLIYNMNPGLYKYIANIVRSQKIRWEKDRLARESVAEELAAIERSEAMLEDVGFENDN
jgi:hypothetical protein